MKLSAPIPMDNFVKYKDKEYVVHHFEPDKNV